MRLTTRHASPLGPSSGPRHTLARSRHATLASVAGSSAGCTCSSQRGGWLLKGRARRHRGGGSTGSGAQAPDRC